MTMRYLTTLKGTFHTLRYDAWILYSLRTCMKNRMCNQWDNWRAYGPELLLQNQLITDTTSNKTYWTDI